MSTSKRLYRSTTDRKIAGVCGGLADYFQVDPTLVRIIFLLMFFAGGPGAILYFAMAIIVPEEPTYSEKAKNDDF